MINNVPMVVVGALFVIGLYGVLFKRNIVKIAIAVSIIESSTNLFLIVLGYRTGGSIPVYTLPLA